jgi:hypothetical protein
LTALAVAVPAARVIHHNWDLGSKGFVISAAIISGAVLMAVLFTRAIKKKPVVAIWLIYVLLVPVAVASASLFWRTGQMQPVMIFGALAVFVFILTRIAHAALARKTLSDRPT